LNVTNLFYTVSVILQFQPAIAVNSPLAPLVPLSFVVLIGLLKELLADLKRWHYDRRTNKTTFKRLSKKKTLDSFINVRSDELKVGDIISISDNDIVPADCLLLHTVEKHGECFIQTA
jgi:phospholipid-translocating ATPase